MKKSLLFVLIAVLGLGFSNLQAQCNGGRYYDKIFTVKSTTDVTFGSAVKFDNTVQTLKLNVYEPQNDNFAHRPLIILAFGGSFTNGWRESPDINVLCNDFAKRGYVCATIDYRLGFEGGNDSDTNQFKALLRGVQDMKAAVRFFYKDAQQGNDWRVDTSQIFIGGVSAGGFISLNYAYFKLDTTSRPTVPSWVPGAFLEVGGLTGTSGNPGFSEKVKGVINLCGAIADTVWVMPTDPIFVAVHGTADSLVPCYYDSAKAAGQVEALLFGSGDLNTRANNVGLTHYVRFFPGAPHAPFVLPSTPYFPPSKNYMDTTIEVIRDFLYQNIACDSTVFSAIGDVPEDIAISAFPNPSNGDINIYTGGNKDLRLDVYSVDGRWMEQKILISSNMQRISRSELGAGVFFVQFSDYKTGQKLKTIKAVFY